MSLRTKLEKGIMRLLSLLMSISVLAISMPMFINSADIGEYDQPWLWPVPGSYLVNGLDYYYSGNLHSNGQCIDIDANGYTGEERLDVVSATSGEVFYIQNSYNESANRGSGWGNYVAVKSGNTIIIYAHLQSVTCRYGKISAGDIIGKMGNTGNSTGVHLHVQAYPTDEGVSSTSIKVFDKFKDNPEYIPRFAFRSGLEQYSKSYSDHILTYYKSLSGSYFCYSGGYDGTYDAAAIGAVVKSIRVAGARVYSQPSKSSQQLSTVDYLTEFEVYGCYTDPYGTIWYLLSDKSEDKWVCETDVGFSSYIFGAECLTPSTVEGTYGTFSNIYFDGAIRVKNDIESVKAEIRSADNVVASCVIEVNAKTFDINNAFSEAFGVSRLPDGEYTYEVFVTETAAFSGADKQIKTHSVIQSQFIIDSAAADDVPPLVEEIKLTLLTDSQVSFSVIITDNKIVRNVTFNVTDGSGYTVDFDGVNSNDCYLLDIPISSLNGSGIYTITATASDKALNTDSSSLTFVIPSKPGHETRKVKVSSSLTLREGPGTSYTKTGSKLKNNNIINVTDIVYNSSEGRYWGYTGSGWCALEYTIYESGGFYNITFNLCGGTSDMPLILTKGFSGAKDNNVAAIIPSNVPVKPGYTFLGWSTSSTSGIVEYKPSDTYTENSSAVLYAVWQDNTPPVISGFESSTTDSVGAVMTLTVNASDNGGIVYYSFDGGVSWRRSNTIQIAENTTIPSGTIKVKDTAGNIVTHDSAITVSNIDGFYPDGNLAVVQGAYLIVKSQMITASSIISSLEKQDGIKIYDINGAEMNGTDSYVYTSCVISSVTDSGITRSLTIVVLGDVSMDGVVSLTDTEKILMLSNGMLGSASSAETVAADIDGDGSITSLDAFKAHTMSK